MLSKSKYNVKGLEKLFLYSTTITMSITILKLWDSLSEWQNNSTNMTAAQESSNFISGIKEYSNVFCLKEDECQFLST